MKKKKQKKQLKKFSMIINGIKHVVEAKDRRDADKKLKRIR